MAPIRCPVSWASTKAHAKAPVHLERHFRLECTSDEIRIVDRAVWVSGGGCEAHGRLHSQSHSPALDEI